MKTVISVASVLACAFSLDAQIIASLNPLPDGSTEIKIRNDAPVTLAAFAISVKLANDASGPPLTEFVDPAIDMTARSVLPNKERVVKPERTVMTGKLLNGRMIYGPPVYEQPIVTAGIFADGATTGDAALLNRLILRRCNMLQAVEMALEMLSDAGRHNAPRGHLIKQFKMMADSVRRWYLPPDQRVGSGVYQSIVGKLINLPEEQLGSPFPPTTFVAQETAMLNRQRVTLLESQPSLANAAVE
jgi:hypothetical protein